MIRSLCTLALVTSLAAQTPPCISLNDATTSVGTSITAFGFAGPGVNAYQFTPTSTLVLQSAQVFTTSVAATTPRGYQTLEIWDTNLLFLPQSRLGGGTWQNQPTTPLTASWQGANFDAPVVVAAGTTYWLVWRESGGNLLPYEPGGVQTAHARFTGGNWVLQAAGQALKWRGFCSLLDGQGVAAVGVGCASSSGSIPGAFTNNPPAVGNNDFQFEASGFPSGALGISILGANPGWVPVPIAPAPAGCVLYADLTVLSTVPVGTGNQQATHAIGAAGHCWIDVPLPNNPALVGFVLDAQFAALDLASTASLPFVFTNGVRVTLF